jgi:hypothetical protein
LFSWKGFIYPPKKGKVLAFLKGQNLDLIGTGFATLDMNNAPVYKKINND